MHLYDNPARTFDFSFKLDDSYEINEVRIRHGANVEFVRSPLETFVRQPIVVSFFDGNGMLIDTRELSPTHSDGVDYEVLDVGRIEGVETVRLEIVSCDAETCFAPIALRDVVFVGRQFSA